MATGGEKAHFSDRAQSVWMRSWRIRGHCLLLCDGQIIVGKKVNTEMLQGYERLEVGDIGYIVAL